MASSFVPSISAPPARSSRAVFGLTVAVASALAFSSSGPLLKPLLAEGWSIGAVLIVRMTLAALVLTPALVIALRRHRRSVLRSWPLIVGFGLTAVAGCQLFFFSAMQRMPVAVALLIQYLAPVMLVALAWVRSRRTPPRLVLAGTVVAILGLVLVVDIAGARFDLVGTLFALMAAICVAAYFLIVERAGDEMPPLALAAGGLWVGALVIALLAVTGVLPARTPSVSVEFVFGQVPWFVPLLWVGLLATSLGYALGVKAVPLLGARVASFVGLSEVLFALMFAWILLGEAPSWVQVGGGVLIVAGVVLVRSGSVEDDVSVVPTRPEEPALGVEVMPPGERDPSTV